MGIISLQQGSAQADLTRLDSLVYKLIRYFSPINSNTSYYHSLKGDSSLAKIKTFLKILFPLLFWSRLGE